MNSINNILHYYFPSDDVVVIIVNLLLRFTSLLRSHGGSDIHFKSGDVHEFFRYKYPVLVSNNVLKKCLHLQTSTCNYCVFFSQSGQICFFELHNNAHFNNDNVHK